MNDTTAAHEAATIEAMHTGGAIPSPLWTENQRLLAVAAELREQVANAVRRAEAAEADATEVRRWADAVPVNDIRSTVQFAGGELADLALYKPAVRVMNWLDKQHEVQP